ncbi:MAG TPA: S8 family serine peptidase, partial [Candidatus Gracilibacteria bacterium]
DYKTKTKKVWLAWMVGISLFGFGAVGAESGSICINGQNPEHPYNIDGDVNHNINVLDVVGLLGAIEGRNTTVCGNVNGDLKPDGTERVDILDLVSWLRWRENPTPLIDGEAEVEITSPGKSEDPVREIEAITWGGVKHATNYQLYFAKADEPDTPIMVPLPEADQLTYDLPNDGTFEPGVTYIVRIRGLDEDRNGTSIMGNEYGFEVTDSYQIEEEDQDDPRAQKSPFEDSPIIMTESEAQVSFSPGMKGVWERMGYWGDQLMTNVTGSPQKVRGEMTVVADRLCLYERRENHGDHFFDTYISVPEAYTGTIPAITDELYTINLGASGVAYDQLTEAIEQDDCVIGLTNITRSAGVVMDDVLEIPGGALGGEDYDYFEALDYDRSTKDWFGQNIDQRLGRHITVAVLDTGVDFGNTGAFPRGQFESFVGGNFPYFPGANMSAYLYGSNPGGELPDEPRDTIGHGTAVTKIITDINPYAKILPIKIAANDSQLEQVSPQKLYEIIRRSTNMGADVVNMSFNAFTGSRGMCHPLVGHAIYKSIEKDVFFVSAAGNGIKIDANGVEIPGELKHVSDFGPAEYGDNAYPACWGKYFKGMMTVSSLDRGKNLDFFSNHGEPVEIATFGTNVKSIGLGSNAERIYSGTSFSAPQISAAVALTKGWLRKRNLPEDPWFVEDVLLTALNQSRSGNLEGKITGNRTLDLGALKIYLDYLDQVSPAQVRFLPSIPYRTGEGWRPDRDRDYHEGIIISADTNPLLPGNSTQMKASLLLEAATGNLPEVTSETFWTSSDPQKAPVNVRTGEVSFASDKTGSVNIIGHYKGLEDSEVVEVFVEEGKEGYRLERLQVKFEDALLREDGLLELPWYEQDIPFEVQSVYTHVTSPEGNPDIIENILSEVEIESSVPDELQLLEHNKGHLNTVETYGGEDYALTFRYRGREKIVPIYIQPRAYIDQEIHSPLGLAVHESQDVIYQYRLTLEGEVIPVPFRADWRPVSPELARDEVMVPVQNSREQYIDATKLPLGFYTIGVDVFYKGNGRDPITRGPQIIQDEFTFEVTDRFEHLEVLTKRQFLEVGQRGLMELRIYHDPENNSHETI